MTGAAPSYQRDDPSTQGMPLLGRDAPGHSLFRFFYYHIYTAHLKSQGLLNHIHIKLLEEHPFDLQIVGY
jgi:hypothetical protein